MKIVKYFILISLVRRNTSYGVISWNINQCSVLERRFIYYTCSGWLIFIRFSDIRHSNVLTVRDILSHCFHCLALLHKFKTGMKNNYDRRYCNLCHSVFLAYVTLTCLAYFFYLKYIIGHSGKDLAATAIMLSYTVKDNSFFQHVRSCR